MHPSYFFYRTNLTRLQQTYFEEILSMSLLWRSLQRGMTFASFFYPETSTSFFFLRHLYSSTCLHGLSHDSFTVPRYEPLDPRFFIFFCIRFCILRDEATVLLQSCELLDLSGQSHSSFMLSWNQQKPPKSTIHRPTLIRLRDSLIHRPTSCGLEIHWFIEQLSCGLFDGSGV